MTGASTAMSISSTMMMSPSTAIRLRRKRLVAGEFRKVLRRSGGTWVSAIADPWVQQRVGQVYQQVYEDEHHGDEQYRPLDERAVLHPNRVHHQSTQAGPGEHRFGQNRTAEQATE